MMVDQVTLLHSQLVFERNQCLQHAARNRRLLSMLHKAGADKEDLLTMVRRWFFCYGAVELTALLNVERSGAHHGAND